MLDAAGTKPRSPNKENCEFDGPSESSGCSILDFMWAISDRQNQIAEKELECESWIQIHGGGGLYQRLQMTNRKHMQPYCISNLQTSWDLIKQTQEFSNASMVEAVEVRTSQRGPKKSRGGFQACTRFVRVELREWNRRKDPAWYPAAPLEWQTVFSGIKITLL